MAFKTIAIPSRFYVMCSILVSAEGLNIEYIRMSIAFSVVLWSAQEEVMGVAVMRVHVLDKSCKAWTEIHTCCPQLQLLNTKLHVWMGNPFVVQHQCGDELHRGGVKSQRSHQWWSLGPIRTAHEWNLQVYFGQKTTNIDIFILSVF